MLFKVTQHSRKHHLLSRYSVCQDACSKLIPSSVTDSPISGSVPGHSVDDVCSCIAVTVPVSVVRESLSILSAGGFMAG